MDTNWVATVLLLIFQKITPKSKFAQWYEDLNKLGYLEGILELKDTKALNGSSTLHSNIEFHVQNNSYGILVIFYLYYPGWHWSNRKVVYADGANQTKPLSFQILTPFYDKWKQWMKSS